jgi:hypothetical protein
MAIYAIVWGQCSPMMQTKLRSLADFTAKDKAHDCGWIIKEIQAVTHRFEGTRYAFISLTDALQGFYSYGQSKDQSLLEYLKTYQSLVQVLDHYKGLVGTDEPLQELIIKEAAAGTLPSGDAEKRR